MTTRILDTDTLSEILKGRNAQVVARARDYGAQAGRFTITAVTVLEVVSGWQRVGRAEKVQQFLELLSNFEILPLDTQVSEVAGRIEGDLVRTGQPIGRGDVMIAGIAVFHGFPLVTGNTAHYERVQSLGYPLQLDNWKRV
ncbi:type II toxin-antitoxin system VapC family toxin [Chondromyces apiculatus]|uniref:Putative virulence-associated protein n=1 Tax=Chondromyces apiculatus DSM 436 TaxID=1192034 RepID=A0A017TEV1_9BACT|nr:type II toxin-antitoxin system VapC family toxin [Chondromyces apiculatus]EYF07774.1 putative virulence-associated protein [Chondromyces apiculatus DSM 436]